MAAIPTPSASLTDCPCCQNNDPNCLASGVTPDICTLCYSQPIGVQRPKWKFFAEQVQCCQDYKASGITFTFRIGAQHQCVDSFDDSSPQESNYNNPAHWFSALGIGNVEVGGVQVTQSYCQDPILIGINHPRSGSGISVLQAQVLNDGWVNEAANEAYITNIFTDGVTNQPQNSINYKGIVLPISPNEYSTGIGYYYYRVKIGKAALDAVGFMWGDQLLFDWSINARYYGMNKDNSITQNKLPSVNACNPSNNTVDVFQPLMLCYPFADVGDVSVSSGIISYPFEFNTDPQIILFSQANCCSIGLTTSFNACPGYEGGGGMPWTSQPIGLHGTDYNGANGGDTCSYPSGATNVLPENSTFWQQNNRKHFICDTDILSYHKHTKSSYSAVKQSFVVTDNLGQTKFDTTVVDGEKVRQEQLHNVSTNAVFNYTYRVLNRSSYLQMPTDASGATTCGMYVNLYTKNGPAPTQFDVIEINGYQLGGAAGVTPVPITITNNVYSTHFIALPNPTADPNGDFVDITIQVVATYDFEGVLEVTLGDDNPETACQCDTPLIGGFYTPSGYAGATAVMCSGTEPWQRENNANCWNVGIEMSFIVSQPAGFHCDCSDVGDNNDWSLSPAVGSYLQFGAINIGSSSAHAINISCGISNHCDGLYFDTAYNAVCDEHAGAFGGKLWAILDNNGVVLSTAELQTLGLNIVPPTADFVTCGVSSFEWLITFSPTSVVNLTDYQIVVGWTISLGASSEPKCCFKTFYLNAASVCDFDCGGLKNNPLPTWYIDDKKGVYIDDLILQPFDHTESDETQCVCKLDDLIVLSQLPINANYQAYRQLTIMNPSANDIVIEVNRINCLGAEAVWIDFGDTVLLPNPTGTDTSFLLRDGISTGHTYGTIKVTPGATIYVNLYFSSLPYFLEDIDVPCGPSSIAARLAPSTPGLPPADLPPEPDPCDEIGCMFDVKLHIQCPVVQEDGSVIDVWEEKCENQWTPGIGLKCCDCPPNCPCEDGVNATSVELENLNPNTEDELWGSLFNAGVGCCPVPDGNYCFVDHVENLVFNLISEAEENAKFNWTADKYNIVNDIFYLYSLLAILDWERYLQIQSIINSGVFDATDPCDWEFPSTLGILEDSGLSPYSEDESKSCIFKYFQCKNIDILPLLECKGLFTKLSLKPEQYELLGIEEPLSGVNHMCIEDCIPSVELCPATQFKFIVK